MFVRVASVSFPPVQGCCPVNPPQVGYGIVGPGGGIGSGVSACDIGAAIGVVVDIMFHCYEQ